MIKVNDVGEKLILLCAGGTGGHMFPADALARDLLGRGFRVELATDVRGKRFEPFAGGIPIHIISSGALKSGLAGKLESAGSLVKGFFQSRVLLKRIKPSVVVGFGGYPSFPPVMVAQMMNIPTVIHESNAVMGIANAGLARFAKKIAVPLADMGGIHDTSNMVVTGNPVRPDIAALHDRVYPDVTGILRIFITGGSQGAGVLTDVVPKALAKLPAEGRARIEVVQQCAENLIPALERAYRDMGIKATLKPFFRDMPEQLSKTHLFIGRSGASTVAEMCVAGVAALYVPYPHHKDQQQLRNARAVADAGGAWVIEQPQFTPERLLAKMADFLQNPAILQVVASKARDLGEPHAARKLGDVVVGILEE